MKASEHYFHLTLFLTPCKVVVTFDETLELQYWTFSNLSPTAKVELFEFYTFLSIKLSCIVNTVSTIWYNIVMEKLKRFVFHSSNWCNIDYVRIAILYFCPPSKGAWIDAEGLLIIISIDPTALKKISLAIRFKLSCHSILSLYLMNFSSSHANELEM